MTAPKYKPTCSKPPTPDIHKNGVSDFANIGRVLHCVVADARTKAPVRDGWLTTPATDSEIAGSYSEPYLTVGHVPFGADLLVIDIDTDKGAPVGWWADAVEESLGPPVCTVRTGSGGIHMYYRCDQPIGNVVWEGGEIRCAKGHVVLWNEDAVLAAIEDIELHDPVDCTLWPISKQLPGTSASGDDWNGEQGGKVGAALRAIPCPDVHYDDWIAVGHALHWGEHYGCIEHGLRMWTEWSATDPARFRFGECAAKWRGFDADKGRTLGILFQIAQEHDFVVWRQTSPQPVRPPKPDSVLNERQQALHNWYYSQARTDRRKGGILTVSMENRRLAEFYRVSRKTIGRDNRHMVDEGYLKPAGKRIVRTETGGHVLQVWRPTTPDLERWQQHLADQPEAAPEPVRGGTVYLTDGGVADINPPIPGVRGWTLVVRRLEKLDRAPP